MSSPHSDLLAALVASLRDGTFVKLTLSKPRLKGPAEATQAFVRLVPIRGAPHLSILWRHPTKDVTQNHPVADAADVIGDALATRLQNAHLFTTTADFELRTNNKGEPRLFRHKPTFHEPADDAHDRKKRYVLDPANAPYLRELGIVSPDGHVKSDKADKHRQLQNLVKLLDQFVEKSDLPTRSSLRVPDFGCGKAYLTFAVYDYFNHHLGVPTTVVGVDRNSELMATCAGIAKKLGYDGLTFTCADVGDYDPGPTDVLVALHACDTATDVALHKGVAAGATLVLAVPCCQKELRPQIKPPPDELPLLKHDTFKDRYAQMLTDGMRSLLMESAGYQTRVIEFISDAHTHRNVMIVATRGGRADLRAQRLDEVRALKARYRIDHQTLEALLADG
jgi:SAM-dependent methyltransferase